MGWRRPHPGTEDDYYLTDPDKDGVDDKIYAGKDGVPGTKDDWYGKDVDGDGKDEIIHVGEDTAGHQGRLV